MNTAANSAENLAKAVQGGSSEAMADLYDLFKNRVFSVSYAILRSRSDAEDVTQETFMRAMERIAQLRDPSQIGAWLCSISRSTSLDRIRANKEQLVETWPLLEDQDGTDPTTGLRQAEAVALVADAFDGLSARDRAALDLAELQGLSGTELAIALDVKRDHAYNLVAHARDRFGDSVSALMVCRQGRSACAQLDALLQGWNGELDPVTRKRVHRHITGCAECSQTRSRVASPAALLSVLPAVALSHDSIRPDFSLISMSTTENKETPMTKRNSSNMILAAAAAAVAVATIGYFVFASDETSTAEATPTTETQVVEEVVQNDPVVTTAVPPTETTVTETTEAQEVLGDDYCKVAFEFRAGLTEGPASIDVADVQHYFTRNQGYYERLLELSPDEVVDDWRIFTRAHGGLVAHLLNNDWAISAAATYPTNTSLEESSDTVQTHLEVYCGVPGF